MIPKQIHYCWLSGEAIPKRIVTCMSTWKNVMPDYNIVLWDLKRFDISKVPFVKEACSVNMWAFASDYIRLFALYRYGGLYLDCDVAVLKKMDEFLNFGLFTSVEYHKHTVRVHNTSNLLYEDGSSIFPHTVKPGIQLQAAVLGGEAGHPFLRDCLDWYRDRHFIDAEGEYFTKLIAPDIYAMIAEDYGFRYIDERQELRDDMLVLPSEYFAGTEFQATERSYAIHLCAGSWREFSQPGLRDRLLLGAKKNNFLRRVFRKRPLKKVKGL